MNEPRVGDLWRRYSGLDGVEELRVDFVDANGVTFDDESYQDGVSLDWLQTHFTLVVRGAVTLEEREAAGTLPELRDDEGMTMAEYRAALADAKGLELRLRMDVTLADNEVEKLRRRVLKLKGSESRPDIAFTRGYRKGRDELRAEISRALEAPREGE